MRNRNTQLEIVAQVYAQNGTFLGLKSANIGLLSLCERPLHGDIARNEAFNFGRLYHGSCRLSVAEMLQWRAGISKMLCVDDQTIFYELFVQYVTQTGEKMVCLTPNIKQT